MRTEQEIINEYKEIVYRNQAKRDALKKEYFETLPENKQMAILLHQYLCKRNHIDIETCYGCSWDCEIHHDIDHDWDKPAHKEYLFYANRLFEIGIHADTLRTVLECICQICDE